jgi:hypothetical protein
MWERGQMKNNSLENNLKYSYVGASQRRNKMIDLKNRIYRKSRVKVS